MPDTPPLTHDQLQVQAAVQTRLAVAKLNERLLHAASLGLCIELWITAGPDTPAPQGRQARQLTVQITRDV